MQELIEGRKTITDFECCYYMKQIVAGVKYLHDNHIIHRDLKPDNLFLNENLHVKIGDFGLSIHNKKVGKRQKSLYGTPDYMAPEILKRKGHSYKVDIWSIGCVM